MARPRLTVHQYNPGDAICEEGLLTYELFVIDKGRACTQDKVSNIEGARGSVLDPEDEKEPAPLLVNGGAERERKFRRALN